MTDQSGQIVWSATQTPFGVTSFNEDVDGDGTNVTLNLRLPGQYYDKETGLHYNYFRDYDPTIGRYIQSDPRGLQGGLNTYSYSLQNPIAYVDPTGEGPVGSAAAAACALIDGVATMSTLDSVNSFYAPQLEMVRWQIRLLKKREKAECDKDKKNELLILLAEAQKLLIQIAQEKVLVAGNVTASGATIFVLCAGFAKF